MAKVRRKQIEFEIAAGLGSHPSTFGTNGSTGVAVGDEYEEVINKIVSKIDELDASAGGSVGEWQDSVISFTNDPTGTTNERYIVSEATGLTLATWDLTNASGATVLVPFNSIIEYYSAQSAWLVTAPTTGMFTSVDTDDNEIYRYTGSAWVIQIFEQTYPTVSNKNMVCEVTTANGDLATLTTLAFTPTKDELGNGSYVEVEVNGVEVRVGSANIGTNITGSTFDCAFANPTPGTSFYQSSTGNTITLSDTTGLVVGSIVRILQPFAIYRTIIAINGNDITVDGATLGVITAVNLISFRSWDTIVAGDQLRWFGSNSGYELDAADRISFDYVRI